jgi:hypothetical protein
MNITGKKRAFFITDLSFSAEAANVRCHDRKQAKRCWRFRKPLKKGYGITKS